jgi:hypothetical protein
MAAMDTSEASSLAAVKAAGATPLEFSIGPEPAGDASMACSPWAPSEMAACSPWSPVTPCVTAGGGGHVASSSPMAMSPAFASPGYAAQSFQAFTQNPSVGFGQFAPRQWNAVSTPSSRTRQAPPSPFAASPLVPQSPGAKIRQNAARFGIPLQLKASASEVSAPVPVRAAAGYVMVPSPTTAFVASAGTAPAAAFAATTPAPGCCPLQAPPLSNALIRSMVTPMSASHFRRLRGSGGGA